MQSRFTNHIGSILVLLLAACSLTSCFEVREDITIDKNGAGSYAFLIDMSSSKAMIDLAVGMQATKDRTPFNQMDSSFAKGIARLSNMEGISNVQPINNREQYIFGMSFDFANIDALNAALNQSTQEQAEQNNNPIFSFRKKVLIRNDRSMVSSLADLEVLRSTPEGATQIKALLEGASYVYTVRPKTGKVRSFSNKQSELQDGGKVLHYRVGLLEMMEGKVAPANTIKFKF
ncbi:hypothetical protein [Rhodoflexus sp.]